jgi:alpha/beta superfamily hydrolase
MRSVRIIELRGPAGRLEAVVNEGSPDARFAAVVCHPHPLGGGSLHNKVVYHAMKAINAPESGLHWPVLRFNFRGTGRSEGTHDGIAEAGDVLAAMAWIENEYKLPLVVAGFSFGAAMALMACCGNAEAPLRSIDLRAVVALGLPIRSGAAPSENPLYDYSFLAHCRVPKLFLSGNNDAFATQAELIEAVAHAAEPKHVALVPGADHFFSGHLEFMQSILSTWLKEQVYDPGQRSAV